MITRPLTCADARNAPIGTATDAELMAFIRYERRNYLTVDLDHDARHQALLAEAERRGLNAPMLS